MKLNLDKFIFMVENGIFLGYIYIYIYSQPEGNRCEPSLNKSNTQDVLTIIHQKCLTLNLSNCFHKWFYFHVPIQMFAFLHVSKFKKRKRKKSNAQNGWRIGRRSSLRASNYAFSVVLIKEDKQFHFSIYYVSNCFMNPR